MKEKCFIPLAESVETVKKVIDMAWDLESSNGPLKVVCMADVVKEFRQRLEDGLVTEKEKKKEEMRNFFDTLDRKMLNSIHIVMAIGKERWAIEKPFENPEKEFEEYAEWLHLEENMSLGKDDHIIYLTTKDPLKKFLKDGLYCLGVA